MRPSCCQILICPCSPRCHLHRPFQHFQGQGLFCPWQYCSHFPMKDFPPIANVNLPWSNLKLLPLVPLGAEPDPQLQFNLNPSTAKLLEFYGWGQRPLRAAFMNSPRQHTMGSRHHSGFHFYLFFAFWITNSHWNHWDSPSTPMTVAHNLPTCSNMWRKKKKKSPARSLRMGQKPSVWEGGKESGGGSSGSEEPDQKGDLQRGKKMG